MRRTIGRILALALVALWAASGPAAARPGDHEKPQKKEITLTGEVLDLYCYMQHPASATGPDHAKCAKGCIRKGLPIGFLADGVVYTIIGQDHESAADAVADFAGRKAVLKGKLIEHHGVKAIELISISEAK